MTKQFAPVALFVYNRPEHTRQAVEALRKNRLAQESELFIFSDGVRDGESLEDVLKVRGYVKSLTGFGRVTVIEREHNIGLSRSIISGVNELISRYGRVIVLEDDLVTSPYFLQFMNDALLAYKDEEKVISICGYTYPLKKKHADTFFLRVADCWGWATWKRGWDLFISDGRELYMALKAGRLFKKFNLDNAFDYAKMLKMQIRGRNDSWAVRWYASALLNGKLSLYPWRSLVVNTGFDGSGRHRGSNDYFRTELLNESVNVRRGPVLENEAAVREIGIYLRRGRFNIGGKVSGVLRNRWQKIINKQRKD